MQKQLLIIGLIVLTAAGAGFMVGRLGHQAEPTKTASATTMGDDPKASALTVTAYTPHYEILVETLTASGNIQAWQEAQINAEMSGLKITRVLVNVGDQVKQGQLLAEFDASTIANDGAQIEASVREAESYLAIAKTDAQRAQSLRGTGALSEQAIDQMITEAQTAEARRDRLIASLRAQKIRLAQTQLRAPDDGQISARSASVGAVTNAGSELFRLIRGGRLEWRGELIANDRQRVQVGNRVALRLPSGHVIAGQVRQLAPNINPQTRSSDVFVDLPSDAQQRGALAGMFCEGEFILKKQQRSLMVPRQAVVNRDGFDYVFIINNNHSVIQKQIQLGQRQAELVAIQTPLPENVRLVAQGAAFLADGDVVHVVDSPTSSSKTTNTINTPTQSNTQMKL